MNDELKVQTLQSKQKLVKEDPRGKLKRNLKLKTNQMPQRTKQEHRGHMGTRNKHRSTGTQQTRDKTDKLTEGYRKTQV